MNKPNVILINCDDLGYGDIGCYGSSKNLTPTLDALAENGIRFTDFYMASSVCSPSRGGMLTGCYPPRIGFGDFVDKNWVLFPGDNIGLDSGEETIADVLKRQGYRSKIVGKWHCGDQNEFLPLNHGFDEYYGIPYSNDMGRQANTGNSAYPPLPLMRDNEVIQEQPDQSALTERYTEESVRFIRDNSTQPFFLYLAHMYVHLPIFVPERFKKESKNGPYGAAVQHIDWTTSVLVDELKRQNIYDNTIIIFTSDNGSRVNDEGGSNGDFRGVKAGSFEGGFRVPFIVHWPEQIKQGVVCDKIVSSIDLFPTLASIVGDNTPPKNKIDGVDISAILLGTNSQTPRENFIYYLQNSLAAVRHNEWKLHFPCTLEWRVKNGSALGEVALFNLRDDPQEQNNVCKIYPHIVTQLTAIADEMRQELGDEFLAIKGKENRAIGVVEKSSTLTQYDPNHPYMIAMYDLGDDVPMYG